MDSKNDLNEEILEITKKIQNLYPDLNRYLDEMPQYHPKKVHDGVNKNDLKEYLD